MKHTRCAGEHTRRSFLHGCGLTLAGFGVSSLFPGAFIRHAMAATVPDRKLLFIFLRGGNDGINAVIPHGDPDYNTVNRPTLYIPPASAIDLGNGFASLHPSLAPMLEPFHSGDLAIVHRVGYPDNSRSHFDGQRIWENGDPTQPQLFEGWLARYIAETRLSAGKALPVITVQGLPPLLLRGKEAFVNVANPGSFNYSSYDPKRAKLGAAWRGRFSQLRGLEPYRPILSQTGVKLIDTIDEYGSWSINTWDPKDPDSPAHSLFPVASGPSNPGFKAEAFGFFHSLKACALALLESTGNPGNGTRLAGTELVGFDVHNTQGQIGGRHADLLSWLAYGFRSLRIALTGGAIDPRGYPSIWDKTVVVTMSEFGRTTVENGSNGSDHAAASCLFAMGGPVNGGLYNCDASTWPAGSMFAVDGRYLMERTDYRAVFWEILRDHMGAFPPSPDAIFPGYTGLGLAAQELGLIA
jgi:uncharacterized protein (DUF1501 family)